MPTLEKQIVIERMICSLSHEEKVRKIFLEREGEIRYFLLANNFVEKDKFTTIIIPGYPERAAIWSNTLLEEGRIEETSMKPYFAFFNQQEWGLLTLTPHYFRADKTGKRYRQQLEFALSLLKEETKIALICFSLGGSIIIDYLAENLHLLERIKKIVLIDPVPPKIHHQIPDELNQFIKKNGKLFAVQQTGDYDSLGLQTGKMIAIEAKTYQCSHGELPSKVLDEIKVFFSTQ